jgi:hypothetical protein
MVAGRLGPAAETRVQGSLMGAGVVVSRQGHSESRAERRGLGCVARGRSRVHASAACKGKPRAATAAGATGRARVRQVRACRSLRHTLAGKTGNGKWAPQRNPGRPAGRQRWEVTREERRGRHCGMRPPQLRPPRAHHTRSSSKTHLAGASGGRRGARVGGGVSARLNFNARAATELAPGARRRRPAPAAPAGRRRRRPPGPKRSGAAGPARTTTPPPRALRPPLPSPRVFGRPQPDAAAVVGVARRPRLLRVGREHGAQREADLVDCEGGAPAAVLAVVQDVCWERASGWWVGGWVGGGGAFGWGAGEQAAAQRVLQRRRAARGGAGPRPRRRARRLHRARGPGAGRRRPAHPGRCVRWSIRGGASACAAAQTRPPAAPGGTAP